jgi:hypothetical protein
MTLSDQPYKLLPLENIDLLVDIPIDGPVKTSDDSTLSAIS